MIGDNSTLTRTVAVGFAVLVVAGLGTGSVASLTERDAPGLQDPENAQVRAAHMSPDAPAVNVVVDNETVVENLEYGDVTSYLDLQEGDHQIAIVTAENETTVLEQQVTVEANERYTLVAAGEVGENAAEAFQLVALQDVRRAPNGTNASVRLVHVAPGAGPVDVTVNRTGAVLYDNVTFGDASEYASVPSGVYTLNVREATEGNDGQILASFTESFEGRTAYTGFAGAVTEQGDEPLALFVAIDQTDNPEIPGATTQADNATTTAESGQETTTEA
ncbi:MULTISPECIES: DUF4397 domain-containing protein [Halorussus]|uniref:DUF4397 domain-containing protein n=1 Tax=Halorussus TaxID=1070314 RepID=UPI000E215EB8|nr:MULTISPECIES: DUF4397 domain-containing protein [Halorussus]NHN58857.1 DUF4397 domain-containing protein [Halorussus sp. JP-T4]